MQRFFIDLAGLVDLQFGCAHLFHHRQADVAHGQDVGSRQVGEHVLENVALGRAELVVVVVHVLRHGDFQRRPVVAVGLEEELPGPGVLERRQLVDVGLAIDDALVGGVDRRQRGGGQNAAVDLDFWRNFGVDRRILRCGSGGFPVVEAVGSSHGMNLVVSRCGRTGSAGGDPSPGRKSRPRRR